MATPNPPPFVLDSKNKSAEISYEELAETMEIGDAFAELPKSCPVQPGKLILDVCNQIKKFTGMDPVVKPIIIREQYCNVSRNYIKEEREKQLKDYQIKRMVTKIEIPKIAFEGTTDQMAPAIALTYINTDGAKGMQLAFGENVAVCENLTAFGKFHFSTYGYYDYSHFYKHLKQFLNQHSISIVQPHLQLLKIKQQ